MPPLSAAQQANLPQLQKIRQGIATVVYQRYVLRSWKGVLLKLLLSCKKEVGRRRHCCRSVSNYDGVNMNCGLGYLNDYFKNYFVGKKLIARRPYTTFIKILGTIYISRYWFRVLAGLPLSLYGTGALCDSCVQVWCVDSICANTLVANATFMITDSCQDCQSNSLVISATGVSSLSTFFDWKYTELI